MEAVTVCLVLDAISMLGTVGELELLGAAHLGTWDDVPWQQNFRMSRDTFMDLCTKVAPLLQCQVLGLQCPLSIEKHMAKMIWKLANYQHCASDYIICKGFFLIVLQAVMDHQGCITTIKVEGSGEVHNVCVFRNSGFPEMMKYVCMGGGGGVSYSAFPPWTCLGLLFCPNH